MEQSSTMLHTYDLGAGVTAFSTTRHGGVSQGEYASMNVNAYCGDSEEAVDANRQTLATTLGTTADRLVMPHQVHGTECRQVAAEFFGMPASIRAMLLEGVDAVMTDVAGAFIGVSTADCIPVLLHDPEHHAAAAIHAGWRGTAGRIVARTVAAMRLSYGSRPEALHAVIGPGISVKNFEVGQEVYDAFEQAAFDMTAIAQRHDKWHIDLPLCNRLQLTECGLRADHILMSGICTYDHNADFFSARRQGTQSGRIFTAISLA